MKATNVPRRLKWFPDILGVAQLAAFITITDEVGGFAVRVTFALLIGAVATLIWRFNHWVVERVDAWVERRQARRRAIDEATP